MQGEIVFFTESGDDPERQAEILAYWSKERIANAAPHKIPSAMEQGVSASRATCSEPCNPDLPTKNAEGVAAVPDVSEGLEVTCGKLCFTKPAQNGCEEIDTFCSASRVGIWGVLLTAAHCVLTPNSRDPASPFLNTNMVYVPAWDPDPEPIACRVAVLWDTYYDTGDEVVGYDYAFVTLPPSVVFKPFLYLAYATPNEGASVETFGYPAACQGVNPKNYTCCDCGTDLWTCEGTLKATIYPSIKLMAGNAMGDGASGGPWIVKQGETGIGLAVGVNSRRGPVTNQFSMQSPRFDSQTLELMNSAIRNV